MPRDPMARAFAIGEQSTAEPSETFGDLAQEFFAGTGVIAPGIEIPAALGEPWPEDERWRRWREWIERRKTGTGSDRKAAGRKGGLKGGRARAARLSPEKRSEIARKAAAARWAKRE